MSTTERKAVKLYRTGEDSILNIPDIDVLNDGELAVCTASTGPKIWMKVSDGSNIKLAEFRDKAYIDAISASIVTEIIDDEEAISSSLNDLNNRIKSLSATTLEAGSGITISSNTISVAIDEETIKLNSSNTLSSVASLELLDAENATDSDLYFLSEFDANKFSSFTISGLPTMSKVCIEGATSAHDKQTRLVIFSSEMVNYNFPMHEVRGGSFGGIVPKYCLVYTIDSETNKASYLYRYYAENGIPEKYLDLFRMPIASRKLIRKELRRLRRTEQRVGKKPLFSLSQRSIISIGETVLISKLVRGFNVISDYYYPSEVPIEGGVVLVEKYHDYDPNTCVLTITAAEHEYISALSQVGGFNGVFYREEGVQGAVKALKFIPIADFSPVTDDNGAIKGYSVELPSEAAPSNAVHKFYMPMILDYSIGHSFFLKDPIFDYTSNNLESDKTILESGDKHFHTGFLDVGSAIIGESVAVKRHDVIVNPWTLNTKAVHEYDRNVNVESIKFKEELKSLISTKSINDFVALVSDSKSCRTFVRRKSTNTIDSDSPKTFGHFVWSPFVFSKKGLINRNILNQKDSEGNFVYTSSDGKQITAYPQQTEAIAIECVQRQLIKLFCTTFVKPQTGSTAYPESGTAEPYKVCSQALGEYEAGKKTKWLRFVVYPKKARTKRTAREGYEFKVILKKSPFDLITAYQDAVQKIGTDDKSKVRLKLFDALKDSFSIIFLGKISTLLK